MRVTWDHQKYWLATLHVSAAVGSVTGDPRGTDDDVARGGACRCTKRTNHDMNRTKTRVL